MEEQFGARRGQPGQWAAALRIVNPSDLGTLFVTEMDNNETIISICLAPLGASEPYLVVGTAQKLTYFPTDCEGGCLSKGRQEVGFGVSCWGGEA